MLRPATRGEVYSVNCLGSPTSSSAPAAH